MKGWDIIGDIHGHSAKLEGLLAKLGYHESGGVYRHPHRRVLFLGDYIDRGPDVRRVLQIVRAMVEAGEAVALAGNHEVNAVHYHTKGPNGQPLRPHSKEKAAQHAATLEQFADCPEEWNEWLGWFSKLPLFFETEDFRAIHACWSDKHIENVRNRDLTDTAFLFAAADKHQPEGRAVEILIKGPELALPPGVTLRDKNGTERKTMRVRWWNLREGPSSYGSLVMPPGSPAPEGIASEEELGEIPEYPPDAKPVFIGHYWLGHPSGVAPLADNVVCLDFSAGADGPLVACRWNGSISASEYYTSPHEDVCIFDIGEELDRYFDDSSRTLVGPPRIVIYVGGVASGKSTLRRKWNSQGYVLIDAAEVFRNLSRGLYYDFPGPFVGLLDIIGKSVAARAVAERRNIVTELIGADYEATKKLFDAMTSIGYSIEAKAITCDVETAMQRNSARGDDNISAYYAESFQRTWLQGAATALLSSG